MDDANDNADDNDISFAGVPVPNPTIMTNDDNNLDTESDHSSIDPNEDDENSSKASVHSTRSHLSVHSATSEPPQHPPEEEDNLSEGQTEMDDIELPKLETQVPMLYQSERVSVPPSDYTPWMGRKTYIMNIQAKSKQDHDKKNGLVYNHDEARVLATVITTFNEHMECVIEEHGHPYVVTYSLKAGINKFGD